MKYVHHVKIETQGCTAEFVVKRKPSWKKILRVLWRKYESIATDKTLQEKRGLLNNLIQKVSRLEAYYPNGPETVEPSFQILNITKWTVQ